MPDREALNALSGEFGDLFEQEIIDPLRMTLPTLERAASVAAFLLTTGAVAAVGLIAQPGAIVTPGFGELAEGLARPPSPVSGQ
jgi:chaperonin GroEL